MLSAVLFIVYFVHIQCKSVTAWYNVCVCILCFQERRVSLHSPPIPSCCAAI